MDIVSSGAMQWRRGPDHRGGGVMFKDLFAGEPGPGNYWFTLVHVDGYSAPTHRHNFDQVRVMIEGGFGFGPQMQPEGTVGYFTAGVAYTQESKGQCFHLLLQCESGDAEPYVSQLQVADAVGALKRRGHFLNGHYIDESGAEPVKRDGFEACWEEIVGRPISYPAPRYDRPLIMDPEAFRPQAEPADAGVMWRRLGVFNERQLAISYLELAAGAETDIAASRSPWLLYAMDGSGIAASLDVADAPQGSWSKGDGLRLQAGERARLRAETEAKLFCVSLPV